MAKQRDRKPIRFDGRDLVHLTDEENAKNDAVFGDQTGKARAVQNDSGGFFAALNARVLRRAFHIRSTRERPLPQEKESEPLRRRPCIAV